MIFPTDSFNNISLPILVSDEKIGNPRYYRNRSKGPKTPYFEIELSTGLLPFDDGMRVNAFLNSLDGEFSTFTLKNPYYKANSYTGQVTRVQSAAVQGQVQILLKGFSPNLPIALKAGDFIQFNNHKKAYQLLLDAHSDGNGYVEVTFTQGLIENLSVNELVNIGESVNFNMSLSDRSDSNWLVNSSKFLKFRIVVIEQA